MRVTATHGRDADRTVETVTPGPDMGLSRDPAEVPPAVAAYPRGTG